MSGVPTPLIRDLCTLGNTTELLGVGSVTVYRLINEGELVRVKIGSRTFITRQSIDAYVERLVTSATPQAETA